MHNNNLYPRLSYDIGVIKKRIVLKVEKGNDVISSIFTKKIKTKVKYGDCFALNKFLISYQQHTNLLKISSSRCIKDFAK